MRFIVLTFSVLLVACGAKSALNDPGMLPDGGHADGHVDGGPDGSADGGDRLMVDCGRHNRYTSPGRPVAITPMIMASDPAPNEMWTLGTVPPGSRPVFVSAMDTAGVTPDVDGDYPLHFDVRDRSANHATCDYVVHSVTGPPIAICPEEEVRGTPRVPVRIEGAGYDDVRVVSYSWAITAGPMAVDSVAPTDMPVTMFVTDTGGPYELTLTVTDDTGATGSCVAHVTISNGPTVSCPPDGMHVPTRQPVTETATADEGGAALSYSWMLTGLPAGSATTLSPTTALSTTLTPDLVGTYALVFTATDAAGLSAMCEIVLTADPSPPTVTCPAEIDTTPLSSVDITATVVADFPVSSYAWSLTSEPPGSGAMAPAPPNTMTTTFHPDVAGDYHVSVLVTDAMGQTGTCTTLVRAAAAEGLRVEMYWNPPDNSCGHHMDATGCDGSDVDLHLADITASSWFNTDDCYYANCQGMDVLDWGAGGPLNDPHLDLDTTTGFGPENTNIDMPLSGTYTVGVHYYSDHGAGNTAATYVNIYCGIGSTTPIASFGPVILNGGSSAGPDGNDFWRVANVTVGGGTCTVMPILDASGAPDIRTATDAMSRR